MQCELDRVRPFEAGEIEHAQCRKGLIGDVRVDLQYPPLLELIDEIRRTDRVALVREADVVRGPRAVPRNDLFPLRSDGFDIHAPPQCRVMSARRSCRHRTHRCLM
jgi:hypothetical protein